MPRQPGTSAPRWRTDDTHIRYLPELRVYADAYTDVPEQFFSPDVGPHECFGHTRHWTGRHPYHTEHRLLYDADPAAGDVVALAVLGAAELAGDDEPFWHFPADMCSHHHQSTVVQVCNAADGGAGHPNLSAWLPRHTVIEATWDGLAITAERLTVSQPIDDRAAQRILTTVWGAVADAAPRDDLVAETMRKIAGAAQPDTIYHGLFRDPECAGRMLLTALGLG